LGHATLCFALLDGGRENPTLAHALVHPGALVAARATRALAHARAFVGTEAANLGLLRGLRIFLF
jgi:hypothetical protein